MDLCFPHPLEDYLFCLQRVRGGGSVGKYFGNIFQKVIKKNRKLGTKC